ncbi:hypothetical protein B0T26DRAFT_756971 [Lasiosphaeria miniovina]|uniref:Inositol-3-phosphate synthase n=1 Tax=Lasiosphaeria miniovina TaxID=1954250 RepID=A0AA39ZTK9_9PEZI|nr:uncharacterized protein B0T26DRAFT_756971 [Lasiosphaeria miniovina]KAK0703412.1 hypothetical protein B0T26DRAFT_756971 [Lasiosphaeria miniovina]
MVIHPVDVRPFDGGRKTTANGPSSCGLFAVNSPNLTYTESEIRSKYAYHTTIVSQNGDDRYVATPKETVYNFKVDRKVSKVGVMLVGWGGSNGSTLGTDAKTLKDVNIPFHDVLPIVHPNDLVIGGWDISSLNLAASIDRAAKDQVDNLISGSKSCTEHVERIRKDIRDFKAANNMDKAIVQWTANMEHYADIIPGVNGTAENILRAITDGHEEVSPSTVFAVACIL